MLAAAAVWAGAVTGRLAGWWPALALLVVGLLVWKWLWLMAAPLGWKRLWPMILCLGLAAGSISGATAAAREQAVLAAVVPAGPIELTARALDDPIPGRYGWSVRMVPDGVVVGGRWNPWSGPPLAVGTSARPELAAGERAEVRGTLTPDPGFFRGSPIAGRVSAGDIIMIVPRVRGPANALRSHILGNLEGDRPGRGLLAGFLVGDTTGVTEVDLDHLRRAGLSHFVAVSGSNVAIFVGLWWAVLAPFTTRPRVRAVIGLAAVVLFALMTRLEPSVVRAGAMVAAVLVGRLGGIAIDAWTALGLAVAGSILLSGDLALDVGFQLSVAATAGILVGSGVMRFEPRAVAAVVGASLAAQVAVAPILLAVFGTLPALAPLANLAAAPLVSLATVSGGLGALSGWTPLIELGATAAEVVLAVARVAAPWPQLGWGETASLAAGVILVLRWPLLRPAAVLAVSLAVALVVWPGLGGVDRPAVVYLDIGQGDAALVLGNGFTMLIDGGPDPVLLEQKLDQYAIEHIDLVVASHAHADHVAGLEAVLGRRSVGMVWHGFGPEASPTADQFLGWVATAGVPLAEPPPGTVVEAGGLLIEVLGPKRRYASPNDQSLVLMVTVNLTSHLFPGDIEALAQQELGPVTVDVLKVPHHGAATSDRDWLVASGAARAVISVGTNDFGHPAPEVIDELEGAGTEVIRTDLTGDVVLVGG